MRLLMGAAASAAFGRPAVTVGATREGAPAVKGRDLLGDGWAMRQD